jgi:hypothetical protein
MNQHTIAAVSTQKVCNVGIDLSRSPIHFEEPAALGLFLDVLDRVQLIASLAPLG